MILALAFSTSFVGCEQEESVADDSGLLVQDMMGGWYVKLLYNGEDVYELGYYLLDIYNTSTNTNEIWIDDHELWPTKVKCPADPESLTFAGSGLVSQYSYVNSAGNTIIPVLDITNGKIIKNGTTAPGTGTTTDSIYFEVEFSNDPGTVYTIEGYKSTSKVEDIP
ncbi:hypothetical protein J1D01_09425 [Seonamhaeicola sp. NFXS20]|uniref:lipid-binding protein n=1 Tax=Seonamhaeicola sp. NFXS20 TaxID=2816959 RepID=UPI003B8AFC92